MKINSLLSQMALCIGSGLLASAVLAGSNKPNMRPGLWETTITPSVEGMPMAPPPMTHRSCITHEDLVPRDEQTAKNCSHFEHKITGDTVTWTAKCQQHEMTTVGKGKITYVGDTYSGVIEIEMQGGPGGTMKMMQRMEGRRIGDCK